MYAGIKRRDGTMFGDTTLFQFRALFGFQIEVRSSIIFLALIWMFASIGGGSQALFYSLVTFGILFVSIVLHELGHAWACKVQGIPVREVVVYGGGGYCLPGRAMSRREDEFVTAMGPAVTWALWAILSLIAPMTSGFLAYVLHTAAFLNLFLGIFNLMPVLPLDGGRLFRLVLLRFMRPQPATRIAGGVGLVVSAAWALWVLMALFGGGFFFLLFIPDFARHLQMLRHGH
ncbi:site-2 protease family protein [Maritimibacter dapengensis]|uniref:Site-2 protease family protein n=1 Tax=Maritimibacter dapengensis TaxID=2836868 RepID=A0ABS6T0T2_9RHOB|nr:site-2 protease family protein [Maritimibacter dapengensis]MBV7378844.1 site-2 protease family protein [Maritimibacter dapengensis]